MSWHAAGRFRCDGCKAIETADLVIEADIFQPVPPAGWLRVDTHRALHDLDVHAIRHYCPSCAPLVESYLSGAKATA